MKINRKAILITIVTIFVAIFIYFKLVYTPFIIFVPDNDVDAMIVKTVYTKNDPKDLLNKIISIEKLSFPKNSSVLDVKIEDKTAYISMNLEFYNAYELGESSTSDLMCAFQLDSFKGALFYNREFNVENIVFLKEDEVVDMIGAYIIKNYNYYDFDYNNMLKPNIYR